MSNLLYSRLLSIVGEFKESRKHRNKALELNPSSWSTVSGSILLYCRVEKFDKALEECKKLDELFPDYYAVYWLYWNIYYHMGEEEKSVTALKKALSFFPEDDKYTNSIESIYKQSGMNGVLNMLIEYRKEQTSGFINKAITYAKLGEKEKALEFLFKAYNNHLPGLPFRLREPEFKILYDEPEFRKLLKKMKLDPYY